MMSRSNKRALDKAKETDVGESKKTRLSYESESESSIDDKDADSSDYDPTKGKRREIMSEEEEEEGDDDDDAAVKSQFFKLGNKLNNSSKKTPLLQCRKIARCMPSSSLPSSSKSAIKKERNLEDSGSSSDEFERVPFSLDDLGDFEGIKKEEREGKVTDNDEADITMDKTDDEPKESGYFDFTQIIQNQEIIKAAAIKKENEIKTETLENKRSRPNEAKTEKGTNNRSRRVNVSRHNGAAADSKVNVMELLTLGEGATSQDGAGEDRGDESGEGDGADSDSYPKGGVEVTIPLPGLERKKEQHKKVSDVEAALKRRFNSIKKENQVYAHKVHLLCWIAHGVYLNNLLNCQDLMGIALSIIPSKHCYPPKRCDLTYLENFVEWFMNKIKIDPATENEKLMKPTSGSLQEQFTKQMAASKRDRVLMFVATLRALGLLARLIINLTPLPLKPPVHELFSMSLKDFEKSMKKQVNGKDEESSKKSSDSKPNTPSKSSTKSSDSKPSTPSKSSTKSSDSKPSTPSKSSTKSTDLKPSTPSKSSKKSGDPKTNTPRKLCKSDSSKRKSDSKINANNTSPSESENKSRSKCKVDSVTGGSKAIELNKDENLDSSKPKTETRSMRSRSKGDLKSNNAVKSKDKTETSETKKKTDSTKQKPNSSRYFEQNNKKSAKSNDNKGGNNTQQESKSDYFQNEEENSKPRMNSDKPKRQRKSIVSNLKDLINSESSDEDDAQGKTKPNTKKKSTKIQEKTTDERKPDTMKKRKKSNDKIGKNKTPESDDDSESESLYFKRSNWKDKPIDRRVLSSDDEIENENTGNKKQKKNYNNVWAEVFLEAEEKWICVDLVKGKIHCVQQLFASASPPVTYVLGWENDLSIKDVTRRYVPHFMTVTRKQRIEPEWWEETLRPFAPARNARNREEDEDLDKQLEDQPLPTAISEFKNHPLYALQRHLLKFQAIYPPDAPTVGFIRSEPVYSRTCVRELHCREAWIKHAKVVKPGEEPYKIVKARPKYDKMTGEFRKDLPLQLYGFWQTQDYAPPPAVDGKVPRNEYGNVELYKPCMLPAGTVHMQLPGLNRVAKKLGIDCAPAVVGWDFHCGASHPVMDGFIVCEEYRDTLLEAWDQEVDESAKRARAKVEQRVYGNWKRLIRGLLIREKLKLRYGFMVEDDVEEEAAGSSKPRSKKGGTGRKTALKK